jgi:pyruvate dehydrogenase E2 component (dihydrolipoamide acetyltransferase)
MKTFSLPDLGEGLREAEIVSWHVDVGDRVVTEQPLVSVETDKAVVEIPAPWAGRVAKLHAAAGSVVEVGAPLIDLDDVERVDAGTVVGTLPSEPLRAEESAPDLMKRPAARVNAAPAVRALARKLGVNLAIVQPTGPQGLVTARDVEDAASALSAVAPPQPLRGVRRAMAQKMALSHASVVPASVYDEADVDAWLPNTDITVRLIRAIVAGCRAAPALNAWFDDTSMSRRLHETIDLGIAVATDEGLFVPVIRNVAARDAGDLRRGLDAMKRDVAARHIPLEELRGATITLSNFGRFGAGYFAAMVIIPPQVAIVGAGRVAQRVVVHAGEPVMRRLMPLSLTFDHRVVTGAEATQFLAAIMADLANPT